MRSDVVVVVAPQRQFAPGIVEALKHLLVQTFVPEAAIYGQEEALRKNITALEEAGNAGGDFAAKMAAISDDNVDAKLTVIYQKLDLFKINIGEKMIPIIEKVAPVIGGAVDAMSRFADAHPNIASGIAVVGVGVGLLAAALTPLFLTISAVSGAYGFMTAGAVASTAANGAAGGAAVVGAGRFGFLGRAVKMAATGLRIMAAAALANPVFLVIAAIAAGAALIYANWDTLAPYFEALWNGITAFFSGAWDVIKSIFAVAWTVIKAILLTFTPLGLIVKYWDPISSFFSGL